MPYPAISKRCRSRASVPALQERYAMRAGRSCRASASATSPSSPERGGLTYASRSPPPSPTTRGSAADVGHRRRGEPRRAARSGPHRAPPRPRARHRAPGRRSGSTCAASRRARSRDRARSSPLRHADARRRRRAPRDAARAAVAGRPSGRAPAQAHRAIPRSPRPDAIQSARRAGDPQRDEDAATDLRFRSIRDRRALRRERSPRPHAP